MNGRFSEQELARRLQIYAKQDRGKNSRSQPSYLEAMNRLIGAGCDPEILVGLARAHCLTTAKRTANFLSPELPKFAGSLERATADFWALVDKVGSFGSSACEVAELLQFERLVPLFATAAGFRQLSKRRFRVSGKTRIYGPLLCIYVRQVARKDDYGAIAAIYRALYFAGRPSKRKRELDSDAPRIADARYQRDHPEAYAALQMAVTSYLKVASTLTGERPAHYILLLLAYRMTGNLLEDLSPELNAAA
jgi:hypothetical protein